MHGMGKQLLMAIMQNALCRSTGSCAHCWHTLWSSPHTSGGFILLFHKDEMGVTIRFVWLNETLAYILLELLEQLLMLHLAHPIRGQVGHLPPKLEVDGVVDLSLGWNAWKVVREVILEIFKDGLGFNKKVQAQVCAIVNLKERVTRQPSYELAWLGIYMHVSAHMHIHTSIPLHVDAHTSSTTILFTNVISIVITHYFVIHTLVHLLAFCDASVSQVQNIFISSVITLRQSPVTSNYHNASSIFQLYYSYCNYCNYHLWLQKLHVISFWYKSFSIQITTLSRFEVSHRHIRSITTTKHSLSLA